jgi:hypothetical protein
MITMKDCIDMCGLTEQEVMAIAEHEHVPDITAAAMGRYLLKKPDGAEQIRDMIRDDIHVALSRGDKDHASELLMVLRHFLARTLRHTPNVPRWLSKGHAAHEFGKGSARIFA